jgi:hypothetical protein
MERRYLSLASCYALFAALAVLLLIYAHSAMAHLVWPSSAEWSGVLSLSGHDSLRSSLSVHSFAGSPLIADLKISAVVLRNRMHTTWLFFGVFAAVWITTLAWMLFEMHRRELSVGRSEGWWIAWVTLSVFAVAVLYGLGTNGLLPRKFPIAVTISDVLAAAFILALPILAWRRVRRQQLAQEEEFDQRSKPSTRAHGLLGLNDDESEKRLIESLAARKVVPVDLLPAVQLFHSNSPSEHTKATMNQLIESAEMPAVTQPQSTDATPLLAAPAVVEAAPSGIASFRENLAVLNASWQQIEKTGQELDQWFDQQRQQAIAHLETHPGLRGPGSPVNLSRDFPQEKLAAVDAEWATIRKAALEIARWFGDIPQDRVY